MKKIALMTLIALLATCFAQTKSVEVKKELTVYTAQKSGKQVVALFTTSVGCACTMKRCDAAAAIFDSLALPENTLKITVDLFSDEKAGDKFKITDKPTVVLFDMKGKEIARTTDITKEWFATAIKQSTGAK
jgi:hypothetical protein